MSKGGDKQCTLETTCGSNPKPFRTNYNISHFYIVTSDENLTHCAPKLHRYFHVHRCGPKVTRGGRPRRDGACVSRSTHVWAPICGTDCGSKGGVASYLLVRCVRPARGLEHQIGHIIWIPRVLRASAQCILLG